MRNRGQATVQPLSVARNPEPPEPKAPSELPPLRLASGRTLAVEGGGERFTVRAPDGRVELTVRMTPEGPVLSFSAASIEIEKTGALELRADKLRLEARDGIEIATPGSVSQRIGGNSVTHCEGHVAIEAGSASVTSHKGALVIDSTHDVAIQGARVLLNC